VAQECKETASEFVIPYFNLVIVTTGTNERFVKVEINPTDWTFVFFETINNGAHAVIPTGRRERKSESVSEYLVETKKIQRSIAK
jgi:hypothetical protein